MELVLRQFPAAADPLARYAEWLVTAGIERGLIGPREADRIWDRHIANCAAVAELLPDAARVIDIGSGAGLPGVVLAIVRPDVHVVLVEPLARRYEFLQEVVADLGLTAEVVRGRAEAVRVPPADVVTARAVAPLATLLAWALPLTRPGGSVIAMKGSNAAAEVEAAAGVLAGRTAEILTCGAAFAEPPTTVVRVRVG